MKDANEIDNQGMIPLEGRGKGRERRTKKKKVQDGNNGSILNMKGTVIRGLKKLGTRR